MQIITNHHPRPLVGYLDLTPAQRKDFDYDGAESSSYFIYKGAAYSLADFMQNPSLEGWHGVHNLSAFSGLLVRILDCDGSAIVAYYYG